MLAATMEQTDSTDDPLLAALARALANAGIAAPQGLQRLPDKGLAHDHVRIGGSDWLARIPKQSQMRLSAQRNLDYQAACFQRASVSGHAPHLHRVLPPSAELPRGALLVEHIAGRHALLPQDLDALSSALAAIHALPLPEQRSPLLNAGDPLRHLVDEISLQAVYLPHADPAVAAVVHAELARLQQRCEAAARPPVCLIAFDAHPGNFLLRDDGRAVLVDLEKCRYSYPSLDLAHATLYTSTTWDLDARAVLTEEEVLRCYARWAERVAPAQAAAAQPWHGPLRRAMWLWSLTWCAKWRALSGAEAKACADGEDWSGRRSEAALIAHVRERVDHYLDPDLVTHLRAEFDALDLALAA